MKISLADHRVYVVVWKRNCSAGQRNQSVVVPVFHLSTHSATLVLYGSVVLAFCSFVLVLPKLKELSVSWSVVLDTYQW